MLMVDFLYHNMCYLVGEREPFQKMNFLVGKPLKARIKMFLIRPNLICTIFLISLHEGDCLRAVIHIAKNEMPGAKLPTVC